MRGEQETDKSIGFSVSKAHEIPERQGFSRTRRLMITLPIFIILLGVLVMASNYTRLPADNTPTGQTFATLSPNTEVTFDTREQLPKQGAYKVHEWHQAIDAKQPSTGDVQRININFREPEGAGDNLPAVMFFHGAGYGTCDNSFGDIATAMSSAGFVTAVIDKPVWYTNDTTRDYEGSAVIYEQVINMMRGFRNVNPKGVGLYATSEGAWIASYVVQRDEQVAFQVLLSPMVFSARHALAFLAVQDFALVGANEGYQSIVRRVFSLDLPALGLTNADLNTSVPAAYRIPTLVAYGAKDVMTAQVQGFKDILEQAHKAGNYNVTLRSYPIANHVLRLGDEAMENTPFADDYMRDTVSWVAGTSRGLTQTSEPVAGTPLYQSIAVPLELHSRPAMTWYGIVVMGLNLIMMLVSAVLLVVTLIRAIMRRVRHQSHGMGMRKPFARALRFTAIMTAAAGLLFLGGFAEVVIAVVQLAWGKAPDSSAGMMYWSWPVTQFACVLVLWAWASMIERIIEIWSQRGLLQWPMNRDAWRALVHNDDPIIATSRFGRVFFWILTITLISMLLCFSFWGLFRF